MIITGIYIIETNPIIDLERVLSQWLIRLICKKIDRLKIDNS